MDPIHESAETIEEIARVTGDPDMLPRLQRLAEQVQEVVPDCIGLSLTAAEHGVTITLVASAEFVEVLDAVQFLDDGPCERSVRGRETIEVTLDATDEEAWQLFARAAAARGVASTLSLPIVTDGRVVGGINLYGGSEHCFEGHHQQLADILGAEASAAVTNADLEFSTREIARRAPEILQATKLLDHAAGMLAAVRGFSIEEAQQRIRDAAARARITERRVAEVVIELLGHPSDS